VVHHSPNQRPTSDGDIDNPSVGDTLGAPVICEGGIVSWFRLDPSVEGGKVLVGGGPSYTMILNDVDLSVYFEVECPDPSSPTGYGEPIASAPTPIITDGFTPVPLGAFQVFYTMTRISGEARRCDTNDVYASGTTTVSSTNSLIKSNVASYRALTNSWSTNKVCPGGSLVCTPITNGIRVKYLNGTTEDLTVNSGQCNGDVVGPSVFFTVGYYTDSFSVAVVVKVDGVEV
jgi:hypothetical protein